MVVIHGLTVPHIPHTRCFLSLHCPNFNKKANFSCSINSNHHVLRSYSCDGASTMPLLTTLKCLPKAITMTSSRRRPNVECSSVLRSCQYGRGLCVLPFSSTMEGSALRGRRKVFQAGHRDNYYRPPSL